MMRWGLCTVSLALACLGTSLHAQQTTDPLSSIDWMSAVLRAPSATVPPPAPSQPEPAVTGSASVAEVTVTPLDDAKNSTIGLLPSSVTGLPTSLWSGSDAAGLSEAIQRIGTPSYPALQDLLRQVLLAEVDIPLDTNHTVLLSRVNALREMGSVDAAHALISRAQPFDTKTFAPYFDLSLLLGLEDDACTTWQNAPGLSTRPALHVFCLARAQDWMAANLTLQTAVALGEIPPKTADLLVQFMDPEFAEDAALLPPSNDMSPMDFRLREAIGATLPTRSLPLEFAVTDLQSNRGWKSQLEAAERLARSGALPDNQFLGVFSANMPSASGQIWDRVDALQRFDVAVTARDPSAISKNLTKAYQQMSDAGLLVPFARIYASKLDGLPLSAEAAPLARKLGYLSAKYEATAAKDTSTFLQALAFGDLSKVAASTPIEQAIQNGFENATPVTEQALGPRILSAIEMIEAVKTNDISQLSKGLATLRSVGLEDTARRVALQVLLL